jgi:transcriptional regulator with XRE-family HTH domain
MTQSVVMLPITTQNAPTMTLSGLVASNIRAYMAAQRKTTAELALIIGRDVRAAQRRRSGEQQFSLDELEAVSRWLNVPPNALMARLAAVA